jgi:hypothetical protein
MSDVGTVKVCVKIHRLNLCWKLDWMHSLQVNEWWCLTANWVWWPAIHATGECQTMLVLCIRILHAVVGIVLNWVFLT